MIPIKERTNPIPAFEERIIAFENSFLSSTEEKESQINFGPVMNPDKFPRIIGEEYILQVPKNDVKGEKSFINPIFTGL